MCFVCFFYKLVCLYLTRFRHITLQEKRYITTEKIVVIKCYCNNKEVVASRCNKLRSNRFVQQKNLVAIIPKFCNEQVDAVTSL